jgi:hypothetical protein
VSLRYYRVANTRLKVSGKCKIGANAPRDVSLQAWLADVLARINDYNMQDLDQLLPWNWKALNARLSRAA